MRDGQANLQPAADYGAQHALLRPARLKLLQALRRFLHARQRQTGTRLAPNTV